MSETRSEQRDEGARSRATQPLWLQAALFVPLHLLLVWAGYESYVHEGSVATIWPANGLVLALLLLLPRRSWWVLLALTFADEALVAFMRPEYASAQALRVALDPSNEIECLVGALLLAVALRDPFDLPTVRRRVGWGIAAGIAATALGAMLGAQMISEVHGARYWEAWSVWWVGDTLGILTITPLILAWWARERSGLMPYTHASLLELALAFAGLGLACATIFWWRLPFFVSVFAFPYLLLPFALWIALRFDGRATSAATLLVAAATIVGTRNGMGPFARAGEVGGDVQPVLALQAFLLTYGLTGLLITIAVASRRAEEASRRLTQEELVRSQKLEVVGRLASGVAHDFNNYLTVIQGYASNLRAKLADDPRLERAADQILQAARRAGLLTSKLLAFSRRQVVRPRLVETCDALRDLDTLMRPLLGEGVRLVLEPPPVPLWTEIDPGQLEQVVMNLAINARDAMPEGGELHIGCREVEVGDEPARTPPGLRPGRYVRLDVSDQGTGMGPEVIAHLFEPFFTTKEKGRGTGLGLPTVQDIVSRAEGAVTVESEPGRGSTFSVYLPRRPAPTSTAPPPPAGQRMGAGRSVLVVDDDPGVLEMTRTMLAEEGFAVRCAKTGREALELVREGPGVDLLVTDLLLPDLQGEELARLVREARPATRVLFVSGALREPRAAPGASAPSARLLAKPFRREGLLAEVRAALDGTELVAGR